MNLHDFAQHFSLPSLTVDFIRQYGFEEIACRLEEVPVFLQTEFIRTQLAKLRFDIDVQSLLQAAELLKHDRFALSLINYLVYYWFERTGIMHYGCDLPDFEKSAMYSDQAGAYYLLAALSSFPIIEKKFAGLGIPEQYALDNFQYTAGALAEYAAGHDGKLGIAARKLHWYSFYTRGILFRIGRLEFMYQPPLDYLPAAYRRKSDGKVIALCRDNWLLSSDGLRLFADDPSEKIAVSAKLLSTDQTITGIPINPAGFAEINRRVTLNLNDFAPLWSQWDIVPGVHIPGGGGMTPELCCESLHQAIAFFERYFQKHVAGFSCFSWIFNPDFEAELPESNLAAFMRQLYLFPFQSTGSEGLIFVFGKNDTDWSRYPADNSLRRAFHRLRTAGKRLKAGGMFIERRGLENFHQSIYRHDYESLRDL